VEGGRLVLAFCGVGGGRSLEDVCFVTCFLVLRVFDVVFFVIWVSTVLLSEIYTDL
jgi:hypothetical protein